MDVLNGYANGKRRKVMTADSDNPQSTTMTMKYRDKAIDLCGGVKLTTDWTVTFIAFLATCATLVSW